MKGTEGASNNLNIHQSMPRRNKKQILENSPDSEKFDKCIKELNQYIRENNKNENELIKIFSFFRDISKKSKYQIRILDTTHLILMIKEILLNPKSNVELSTEATKIIMNISKSDNAQTKLITETCLTFNCLFEIFLINLNTDLSTTLLMAFYYITKSKEILSFLEESSNEINEEESKNIINFTDQMEDKNAQVSHLMSKLKLSTITRTFAEQILDDLISTNKKILLEILENLYGFNSSFITKEAIEPLVRCLGDKNNEVVINALKILLFFTKDKTFHNDLLKANFIFRLVRTYKQGIDEMDVVIVKILYDLFDNKNLYEVLFKNNVLLMLSNYLINFEVEKNEKYEEVIKNVFEIFKLINKNTDEENNRAGHLNIQNPLIEDENLQMLIFKKAYSLAAYSKNESSILSCLSLLQIMLFKFSSTLLSSNDTVKSIIELVPPFFKNKKIEIIKYSLSIFEIILNKKSSYFQDIYVQSSNQTFSIKSLVHSVINLVNEFSGNYELLSMSCRILVTLSNVTRLQPYFLQEPQITVLKVFNDNLLKTQRNLQYEEKELEEQIALDLDSVKKNNVDLNNNNNINNNTRLEEIIENPSTKDLKFNTPNIIFNKSNNNNIPSPFKLSGNQKFKLATNNIEALKAVGRKTSGSNHNVITGTNGITSSKNEDRDKQYLQDVKKNISENIYLLKDSFTVISNLSKNVDNLEVLRLKGFLDVITEKLSDNDTETLPYITRCIQGFCQEQSSIDIILRDQIINKILTIYKLYRIEDEKNKKAKNDSNIELGTVLNNSIGNLQVNKKPSSWATTAKRLEVLKSLKNILESDIKLQRTFIIEKGIEILLNDIVNNIANANDSVSDQLNEMILRVIYVVSCNINKLFLIYFSSDENMNKNDNNSMFDSSVEESEEEKEKEKEKSKKNEKKRRRYHKPLESFSSSNCEDSKEKELKIKDDIIKEENSEINGEENDNNDKEINLEQEQDNQSTSSKKKLFKIFTEQLSEEKFMNKLTEVGMYDKNSLSTYKELVKIFINLYLNRYYLEYFTYPKNFDKVINIINKIMKKYKENNNNENGYEILKLVIIFLKFICEDEKLIKKFLKEDVISILIAAIIENEFYENIKEEEIEQFYYNFSLVLLRLTEFNGHIDKFQTFPDFFKTLEKLYDINSVNGKIYVISIIRNIIAEKQDFFEELDLSRFLNKIVSQKNSLIIFEFVELIKNLVHSRSMCKRMESVFRYLINEIKLPMYSADFKKKMLDLILCLSYENSNIKDYSLQDLLTLVKNFDINITQKTTLLLLMNFSSLSNNFSFLMQDYKEQLNSNPEKNKINLTKKDFVQVVNQLIDSDRFSQILIQRLLINITSIDGIDMSIISNKIMKVLLEILTKSASLQDNIIIFSLATLVNIINRNVLRFEEINQENELNTIKSKLINYDSSLDNNGYISGVESNEKLITESNNDFTDNEKNKKIDLNESNENEKESEKENESNNKKILNKKEETNLTKKTSLSLYNKIKHAKPKGSILKKKKSAKIIKKSVGIKTISEEMQQNEEESNVKESGGEKEDNNNNNANNMNDDYRPLPESDKEVVIVDYIIENVPNLIDIIKGLFDKESLDISSLTIMFCCNLLRKIRFSKYNNIQNDLIKCVENYISKEKLLNQSDNTQALLKTDSGKFLLIAIIKYFICLSVEDDGDFFANNLQKSNIPNIIMNNIKDSHSNLKKLKQFKIDISDIKENTINFALVENQLTLFNLILLLIKQKNMKYYFTYRSPNELREYIEFFYDEFINNFSTLLINLKKDAEEQHKINNMHKIEIKDETSQNNTNSVNKSKDTNIKNDEKSSISSKKSKTKKNDKIKNDLISEDDGVILKNQTIQNILISSLKILVEYLVDFDYFSKFEKDRNRSLTAKKDINVLFYNKISKFFESILKCIINEPIEFLYEELKSLYIYILYLILSNVLESKDLENQNNSTQLKQNMGSVRGSGKMVSKYLEIKIETNLENDIDLQKWLMKLFIENKKSIQNDFFCLKIFTSSIHSQNFPNIFHEEPKFIKKLLQFFKYSGDDKRKIVLKVESERILNIMSFNFDSHMNLYVEGVYNIFKSNLYVKIATSKKIIRKNSSSSPNNNQICCKEDFVLLLNMILNDNNKEFIKDDIKKILLCIFPSEDLTNNIRIELFDIYLRLSYENSNDKQFQEDFITLFDSLYENIKQTFTEMIFLFEKFTKLYQNFSKKFLIVDSVLIKIFEDFLRFDKEFPSKPEELICFLKLLELYIEQNEISEDFEKMFQNFMTQVTREQAKEKLRDINILNAILNFSFLYFVKYCEKKGFGKINENTNFNNNEEENENNELGNSPTKNYNYNYNNDESDDYDESSSGDSMSNKNKNIKVLKEINTRIKNVMKEKLKDFVYKCKYSKLIDNIIYNTFHYDDLKGIYILSMLIIQDDYKLLLPPLKEIGNNLFSKEFLLGIYKKFADVKKLDINEFVFVMHLSIVISNVDSKGIECITEIISEIMKIYDKYLMKYLTNPKLYNINYNRGSIENTGDNGAARSNGSNGIDNGVVNREENKTDNLANASITNYFNDTVTSIYFFCDLVKTNELTTEHLRKVLEFLIRIILDIKSYSVEQKEILIRYYQEILLHYTIDNEDELFNIHFNFLKKIHKDNNLNFIEHLMFGTILINTKNEILIVRMKEFLNMITLICLHNELNLNDMDNKKLINFYKFLKQICFLINYKEEEKKNNDDPANNGKGSVDLETKVKIAFNTIEVFVNKIVNKYSNLIKKDDDLTKKFKKLKSIITNNINS